MTFAQASAAANAVGLSVSGGFHPTPEDGAPDGVATLLLLSPKPHDFWTVFTASPEFADSQSDPVDRWSLRVISQLADDLGAVPLYPFGGAPFQPFIRWAKRSGRVWASPVTLLVHDSQGMMISFRGALSFTETFELPAPSADNPCQTCATKPCQTACPVNALTAEGYDVAACKAHMQTEAGQACRKGGCLVRRSCPVSEGAGRSQAQSAHHMRYFL